MLGPKQAFADAVAKHGSLVRLLRVLERQEGFENEDNANEDSLRNRPRMRKGWELLESLTTSPEIARVIIESSAWLELLGILVGYAGFTKVMMARLGAAKTLSKLLWDPRTGSAAGKLRRQ